MKIMFLLVCALAAGVLSLVASLHASGRWSPQPVDEVERQQAQLRTTLFPEQRRAVENLMEEMVARTEALERKKMHLAEREARVRQEEILLTRMREELAAAKEVWEERFAEWETEELGNIRKLAEFFARMDAGNAAQLLSEMNIDHAALILTHLQDRQAGAIMDAAVALGPHGIERAVEWSDAIRRKKSKRARARENNGGFNG